MSVFMLTLIFYLRNFPLEQFGVRNVGYKNREQKLDKATALRKAMLTTKAKYSSPLNWAAFTLIGESE
jgi:hypothetical protein